MTDVINTIKFIITGAKGWIWEYFEKSESTTSEISELEQANEKIRKLEIIHSINAMAFENLQRKLKEANERIVEFDTIKKGHLEYQDQLKHEINKLRGE